MAVLLEDVLAVMMDSRSVTTKKTMAIQVVKRERTAVV
jgi:hypothetical protein